MQLPKKIKINRLSKPNKLEIQYFIKNKLGDVRSLLSGIVFAYLKIIKYFKIFAHEKHERDERMKKRFGKNVFFRFFRVCAWAKILKYLIIFK